MASGLFVKLDPRFLFHRKSVKVGPFGRLLYISALGYCVESLSDGFIPAQVASRLADIDDPDVTASVTALVTCHLWEKVDGGYQVHDYLAWQSAARDVERTRESGKRRQAKYLAKRNSDGVNDASHDALVTRAEPEPEPEPESIGNRTPSKSRPKFTIPSLESVSAYCAERANSVDPQRFLDHYTANGWRVGKNPMKDWQACVRNWEKPQVINGRAPPDKNALDTERLRVNEERRIDLARQRGEMP